jgi:hypothetical protein
LIKFLLKLAIVGLLANAAWQLIVAYTDHYRFEDTVAEAAQYGSAMSIEQLRRRVLDIAAQYDVPAGDSFTLEREGNRTVIDGTYTRPMNLAGSIYYRWPFPFTWHVDVTRPPKQGEFPSP